MQQIGIQIAEGRGAQIKVYLELGERCKECVLVMRQGVSSNVEIEMISRLTPPTMLAAFYKLIK